MVEKGPRKYELKAVMANYKQGGDSVNTYYSRLKKIWHKLDNYMQLPTTTPAEIFSFINKEREKEKFFQFLMGLNDTIYGMVRSNIIQKTQCPK